MRSRLLAANQLCRSHIEPSNGHSHETRHGGALRVINFSKVVKIDQRRDREGYMVPPSPSPSVSTGD